MKCPNCTQENKENAKACKKCGRDLTAPPAWFPDWRWHARTLAIIYACLIVFYFATSFALKQLPEPYNIRKIPAELTPWLKR
ncbi:MAG: zinc-ribbon domain-containing protein [Elusimicrobiota bacterium]